MRSGASIFSIDRQLMTAVEQYLYLTTTGRKTGLPREIEIWFTELDNRYYLIAEHRHRAQWVQNIEHNPQISFRVGAQTYTGTGRIIDEANERPLWQRVRELSDSKYGWSDGLIVELTLDKPAAQF
jgi:deazaflavin-dependent oxidoreductase (nitroreductase family)